MYDGDTSNNIIIALSGKAGAGKSTLARMLKRYIEDHMADRGAHIPVVTTSFASELRRECANAFPKVDWHQKPTPPLVRRMLQTWGQLRREGDPNYWVRAWARNLPSGAVVIVDDLRFTNEAMYLLTEENSMLVRINTVDNPMAVDADVSETDLDTFDYFALELDVEYGDLESLLYPIWQCLRNRPQYTLFAGGR